ncbi:L-2-hydroxyglutarate oxidase [Alkalihalobacterium chitinilyticum]|uniref:L-2-hydroxyglutarate oxidase n=1 Tax=Alkalihalobacterium chitinilyticum TaxID=2980103 RepID=A0ABT5VG03_9BACI|nr:L-2-hydroxyglutarate oxidase [Alkalihalobacterium chitinilyticum]MDE5414386.1 L-2-hydroxyglutarate oxidase [Alkalihalobacterium chitinilyticum]
MYDFAIIGGGIVGLSVGKAILEKFPGAKVIVLEKEKDFASHQTGHNSGVIHSGLYYKPGSFKAKFARQGNESMVAFCQEHQIEHEVCGKVVVATNDEELPLLENLYKRGLNNQLVIKKICADQLKEIEPHVNGKAAIHVPMAGIVNYKKVSETLAKLIWERGGELKLNTKVEKVKEKGSDVEIDTNNGTIQAKMMINCAGLHSDRIAKLTGYHMDMKIVPFRGEYFKLKPEKRYLVKHLIYPVPNPSFPFLGVHFTRMIGGGVEAGPNAVLSLKREGYKKTDFHLGDFLEVMKYHGFWKLARKNVKEGFEEITRSLHKGKFVESLQNLIPEITINDLEPAPAGVRAQALKSDGSLVDDFYIIAGKRSIHVCNAPSPAATASLQIGSEIVRRLPAQKIVL